jgi:hypothetical protein
MTHFDADFLRRRRDELTSHAEESGVELRSEERLPADDDQAAILLLAARLGLSLERAVDPDTDLPDLVTQGRKANARTEFIVERLRAVPPTD